MRLKIETIHKNRIEIMAKKFAEHSGLDLTKTNQEVLSNWGNKDIFHRSNPSRTCKNHQGYLQPL